VFVACIDVWLLVHILCAVFQRDSSSSVVTTFAGNGAFSFADGIGTHASINGPIGLTFDASGNIVVSDVWNQRIRKVTPTGGAHIRFVCVAGGRGGGGGGGG
jgi:hypothetical protein